MLQESDACLTYTQALGMQVSKVAMLTLCTHTPPQHFSTAHVSPISTRPAFATEDYVMNSCHELMSLVGSGVT